MVSMDSNTNMNPRDRILEAVARLLTEGGREAVSTRSVSSAAGVQIPTIYRQFGDMQGLLDAVTSQGYATYLASHLKGETDEDPVEDLRRGWDVNVDFGLANPALYTLMYGNPRLGAPHPTAVKLQDVLLERVRRVAESGRLSVSIEHAADMLYAAGAGVVLVLIAQGGASHDRTLSVATREAVLAAITTDPHTESAHTPPSPRSDAIRYAVALKASLSQDARPFTTAERALFDEWLTRFIDTKL